MHLRGLTQANGFGSSEELASIIPPALVAVGWFAERNSPDAEWNWGRITLISLLLALLLSVVPGWWLGTRYNQSLGARVGWAVFLFLTGVPGLLAFLAVQEWPAREMCPGCKRLRAVGR